MKVLVTGVAGFIGSHLADRLVVRGDEVVGLDSFSDSYDPAIKQRNVAQLRDEARLVEGDILDAALVDQLFTETAFDAVAHLAAVPGVRASIIDPSRYQRVNVEGTAIIAQAMQRHGVGRLVYASSSSVYGYNPDRPYRETDRVDQPASPYAASKRSAELLLYALHRVHGIGTTVLRYFTVYGPRQRPDMAIHKFCRAIEAGQPITLFGQGDSSRDYTYVDDIVTGTVAALDRVTDAYQIYNLGNNQPVALSELVALIGKALGKPPQIEHAEAQAGDVDHTLAAIERAQAELGYRPATPIREGLARFVAWLRAAG